MNQHRNIISEPEMSAVIASLRNWVPKSFSGLADGSKHRTLEKRDDGWYWEGELIEPR